MPPDLSDDPPRIPRPTRPPTIPSDTRRAVVVTGTVIAVDADAIQVRDDEGRVWHLTGTVPDGLLAGTAVHVVTDARDAGRRPATMRAGIRTIRVLPAPH